jgi:hypothetical protein
MPKVIRHLLAKDSTGQTVQWWKMSNKWLDNICQSILPLTQNWTGKNDDDYEPLQKGYLRLYEVRSQIRRRTVIFKYFWKTSWWNEIFSKNKSGSFQIEMMMSHCKKVTWDYTRSDHRLDGGLHSSRKVIFKKIWKYLWHFLTFLGPFWHFYYQILDRQKWWWLWATAKRLLEIIGGQITD